LLGVIILLGIVVMLSRRVPAPAVGIVFFLIALSPTLGIVQYSWVVASDKYVYFPVVGVLLIICWLLRACPAPGRTIMPILVLLAASSEAWGTRRYLDQWQTTERLCRHMIALAPQSAAPHTHLGWWLMKNGREKGAVREYEQALGLDPSSANAHFDLGIHLLRQGKIDKSIEHLRSAVTAKPSDALARLNLGLALLKGGDLVSAGGEFAAVVDLRPEWVGAHINLGSVLFNLNHPGEAADQFRQALALDANQAVAHSNLARCLVQLHQTQDAIAELQAALRLSSDAETWEFLGSVLENSKQPDAAVDAYRQALFMERDPARRSHLRELIEKMGAASRPHA
jgi:Flp pilus assembly protein TadD